MTLHFIYLKLKFFPMNEVIQYTVFIAVYILFVISKVSSNNQRPPKRTNDKARSNEIYLRHRNISVLRLRSWLAWGGCVKKFSGIGLGLQKTASERFTTLKRHLTENNKFSDYKPKYFFVVCCFARYTK